MPIDINGKYKYTSPNRATKRALRAQYLLGYRKGYAAGKKKGRDVINSLGYQLKMQGNNIETI